MTPKEFYTTFYLHAFRAQTESGIPALAMLAQSALETGFGNSAPGNMMFGVKAGKSWTGARQLLKTKEVHGRADVVYPEVISVTKQASGKYLYVVRDWFRAYATPYESFMGYAAMIKANKTYKTALTKKEPLPYLHEVAKAGYATDPDYYQKLERIVNDLSSFKR